MWKGGMSSVDDMHHGSSAFLFTRQNQEEGEHKPNVYLSPRVLTRTHNYAYPDDRYGRISERATHSCYVFDAMTNQSESCNELLIKDAVSLLDDIEILIFGNPAKRDAAEAGLAALGITAIRGVPVATRFIVRGDYPAYVAAVKAARASYHQDW
jgi:hypothetical protein